ncbi:MAG: FAD-dependent thymidylate synthase [Candidatus Micrarchaeia archaeon]
MVDSFTQSEQNILSQFCTSTTSDVFCLMNLPEAVKGALFSRYSRSSKSLRRVLLDEFILNPESGFDAIVGEVKSRGESQIVATKKAEDFYDRVLVGYGDDSVAELGGAHLAAESISMLAAKFMQDSRIGISPLEKSTRYVYFDQKIGGKYRYLREEKIMSSRFAERYAEACDLLFDAYAMLIPRLAKMEEEKNPRAPDVSERAYAATIRAKVCDLLRGILPAATLTNAGFFGNGRAFEYLLAKMYASPLSEMRAIAPQAQSELGKVIPSFVKRANDRYGREMQAYFIENRRQLAALASKHAAAASPDSSSTALVEFDFDAEDKVLSAIIFPQLHCSYEEAQAIAKRLPPQERAALLRAYIGTRANRRQKPGRAFENTFYTFAVTGNFGMYRDLHRHRMMSQERQLLTTAHGFDMPQELVDAGFDKQVSDALAPAEALFREMEKEMPYEAQYVVPLGFRMRWYMKMNLREAYHFCELRSMRQGHPDYRKVAQDMHALLQKTHPLLASGMKFVDHESYALERLEAEKKIDRKLEQLGQKKN